MKNVMRLIFTLCLFSLLGLFNAADAAKVYVMGSPTDFPEWNKTLPVKVRVEDSPSYGYLILELETTSNMNGTCTNAPLKSADTSADLELLKSDNSGNRWSDLGTGVLRYKMPESYTQTTHEFTVYVRAYDYGAWGKLKATLYKKTGTDANGNPVYAKENSDIGTVPRDENGNHIADGWNNDFYPYKWKTGSSALIPKEVHFNNTKKSGVKNYPYSVPFLGKRQNTVDKETGPQDNKENGDGFTVFEEYKGFMTQHRAGYGGGAIGYIRTDPETKDVFYVIDLSISSYGIGDATDHPLGFTEMHEVCVNEPFTNIWNARHTGYENVSDEVGWINTNSDGIPDTEHVYALRIRNENTHPVHPVDYMGLAAGTHKPYNLSLIYIYVDAIAAEKQRNNVFKNVSVNDLVANVISHEVGHMINLDHCSTVCLKNHPKGCVMDPYMSKFSLFSPTVDHYPDYDLAGDVKNPKAEDGSGRKTVAPTGEQEAEPTRSLTSSNGAYTATAGDSHTSNFSTSSPYSSVYWYVKTPSDTSVNGTNVEIDQGNGTKKMASMTYTFPSGVSGTYQIMANVYPGGGSSYDLKYTVSVTAPTSTYSLSSSDGTYTATVGENHTANFSTSSPYSYVYWYVKSPSGTG